MRENPVNHEKLCKPSPTAGNAELLQKMNSCIDSLGDWRAKKKNPAQISTQLIIPAPDPDWLDNALDSARDARTEKMETELENLKVDREILQMQHRLDALPSHRRRYKSTFMDEGALQGLLKKCENSSTGVDQLSKDLLELNLDNLRRSAEFESFQTANNHPEVQHNDQIGLDTEQMFSDLMAYQSDLDSVLARLDGLQTTRVLEGSLQKRVLGPEDDPRVE